jgi:crotonobetainyl-CoA:carnitine CoA-transferase CaiB-like acyl-CoA transferase
MTVGAADPRLPHPLGLPGPARGGALEGVVIVELGRTFAGELAGGLLADLGATVIKVEPRGGSPLRARGPGIAGEDSLSFQCEKRSAFVASARAGTRRSIRRA